jgi:two-component sensor histidine kinase
MSRVTSIEPEDLLITDRLYLRRARAPDLEAEIEAYRELSSLMGIDPDLAIRRFLDLAIELCPAAGSAGLSELATDENGEPIFRWTSLSGAFASFVGGSTPRNFSPCGLCLDNHHTILVDRPARVFAYFNDAEPAIVEGLIVPLYDTGKRPLGTLWVTSHASGARFDATDARVMEQLATQLVLAMKLRGKARVHSQLEEAVQQKDVLVQEVRHRVKNMIQMTSALLHLQQRGLRSDEARSALREAQSRLLVLANVYEALLQPGADTRTVDIAALIEGLVAALRASSPHGESIAVTTECHGLFLDLAHAVPVGLIVNEAITNAFKHGFARGSGGEISVSLRASGQSCSLIISDDGQGFVEPARENSLGMRLMRSLARQLGGEFAIDGSNGTTVQVAWAIEPPEAETEGSIMTLQPV